MGRKVADADVTCILWRIPTCCEEQNGLVASSVVQATEPPLLNCTCGEKMPGKQDLPCLFWLNNYSIFGLPHSSAVVINRG